MRTVSLFPLVLLPLALGTGCPKKSTAMGAVPMAADGSVMLRFGYEPGWTGTKRWEQNSENTSPMGSGEEQMVYTAQVAVTDGGNNQLTWTTDNASFETMTKDMPEGFEDAMLMMLGGLETVNLDKKTGDVVSVPNAKAVAEGMSAMLQTMMDQVPAEAQESMRGPLEQMFGPMMDETRVGASMITSWKQNLGLLYNRPLVPGVASKTTLTTSVPIQQGLSVEADYTITLQPEPVPCGEGALGTGCVAVDVDIQLPKASMDELIQGLLDGMMGGAGLAGMMEIELGAIDTTARYVVDPTTGRPYRFEQHNATSMVMTMMGQEVPVDNVQDTTVTYTWTR